MPTPSTLENLKRHPLYFCKTDGVVTINQVCRICKNDARRMTGVEVGDYIVEGRLPVEATA